MRSYRLIVAAGFFLIFSAISSVGNSQELVFNNVPVKLYFSPNGGCTKAIIDEINNAKSEILVQAYSFTSAPIAKELVAAHKRGVKVEAILDESQKSAQYTSAMSNLKSRGCKRG